MSHTGNRTVNTGAEATSLSILGVTKMINNDLKCKTETPYWPTETLPTAEQLRAMSGRCAFKEAVKYGCILNVPEIVDELLSKGYGKDRIKEAMMEAASELLSNLPTSAAIQKLSMEICLVSDKLGITERDVIEAITTANYLDLIRKKESTDQY